MIERIVYVSKANENLAPSDIFAIIRTAHNRNSTFCLSGALLLIDGYFLQVLEGEGFRLRERFQVIEQDTRHTDVLLREHRVVSDRLFPDDWMALRQGQEVLDLVTQLPRYAPGFPPSHFSAESLLDIAKMCHARVTQQRLA